MRCIGQGLVPESKDHPATYLAAILDDVVGLDPDWQTDCESVGIRGFARDSAGVPAVCEISGSIFPFPDRLSSGLTTVAELLIRIQLMAIVNTRVTGEQFFVCAP